MSEAKKKPQATSWVRMYRKAGWRVWRMARSRTDDKQWLEVAMVEVWLRRGRKGRAATARRRLLLQQRLGFVARVSPGMKRHVFALVSYRCRRGRRARLPERW